MFIGAHLRPEDNVSLGFETQLVVVRMVAPPCCACPVSDAGLLALRRVWFAQLPNHG